MYSERPISIDGTIVSLHAWPLQPKEEKYDYTQQIKAIELTVKNMFESSAIVPVFIEGQAGSGKSVLASVLKENGNNVEIIDVIRHRENGNNNPSKLIDDAKKTYIIDEAGYGDMEIIHRAEEHAKKGGLIILLLQSIRDLSKDVLEFELKPKYLQLERGKISEINI